MKKQKAEFGFKRSLALLFAFVFIFSLILSGCVKSKAPQSGDTTSSSADAQGDDKTSGSVTSEYSSDEEKAGANQTSAFVPADSGSSGGSQGSSGGSSGGYVTKRNSGSSGSSGGSSSPGNTSAFVPADDSGSSDSGKSNGSLWGRISGGSKNTTTTTKAPTSDSVYNDVAWQRKFGFNAGYDYFTGVAGFNIDEVTTYFTYGGKDWLLEFWKGEYEVVTLGGEIGIYYHNNTTGKAPANPRLIHYKCAENEDALYMTMELWQCDSKGDKLVLSRSRMKCWWLAAFEPGTLEKHSRRSDLVLVGSVQFKNAQMLDAFTASFSKKSFTKKSSRPTYKDGNAYFIDRSSATVYFSWKN